MSETIWRHKKRGSTYDIIGHSELQTDQPAQEGDVLVAYRCRETGRLWTRPFQEFYDGRFERLTAEPAAPEAEVREVCWLIERNDLNPSHTHYYCEPEGRKGRHDWTTSPHLALRFPTKEAADATIGNATGLYAREHVFGLKLPRSASVGELEGLVKKVKSYTRENIDGHLEGLSTALTNLDAFMENVADALTPLAARLAECERAAGVACSGCGSTETIEQIRAKHPIAISCCPERDMVPAVTWMNRAEAAEARLAECERTSRVYEIEHDKTVDALDAATARVEALEKALNTPELHDFSAGVQLEAAHQRERWGTAHDVGKQPQDWFWLIGYLAGKALAAHIAGNSEKALHHTISTAAACANWHAAISGADNTMRPGIDPVERGIEARAALPPEAP